MANGLACLTEIQKASVVCPERVRPEASVMVPEMISGSLIADFFTGGFISKNSGFGIEGIKDGFDQDQINPAVDKAFELL